MSESGTVKGLGSKTLIIRSAFMKICSDTRFHRRLQNKWLPAETWVKALAKSHLIDQTLMSSITVGTAFNSAMGRSKGDFDGQMMSRYDGTNMTGIFWLTFQQTMYYIVTDKNTQVPYPCLGDSWKEAALGIVKNIFNIPTTRSFPNDPLLLPPAASSANKRQKTGNQQKDVTSIAAPPLVSPVVDMIHPLIDTTSTSTTSIASARAGPSLSLLPPPMSHSTNCTKQELLSSSLPSYWNSQDACNLFGIKLHAPLDNVRDLLTLRVELLQSVNKSENGWRNAIEGRDRDNLCSASEIFAIRGRSMILCLAYKLAMLNMNKWTWLDWCCSEACLQLNPLGIITQAKHKRTVCNWNNIFRRLGAMWQAALTSPI